MSFKRISQKTDLDYTEPQLSGVLMLQDGHTRSLSAEPATKVRNKRISLGKAGENVAADWLKGKGWQIVATNWRNGKLGEIDIIAEDETKTMVFIEVKTRNCVTPEFGFRNAGFESVHYRKRKKIISCAFAYLQQLGGRKRNIRFDVIVVEYLNSKSTIHHVVQAF